MNNFIVFIHPKNIKHLTGHLQTLVKGRLWLKILIAMFLGIVTGVLLGPSTGLVGKDVAVSIGNWLALPGKIFLGLIQMIVVPLVFASVVLGLAAGEDMENLRKTGLRVVTFFLATTTLAIIIGIGAAMIVQPGQFIDVSHTPAANISAPAPESGAQVEAPSISQVPEFIADILPSNPLGAMVDNQMLQVVLFAVIFGLALVTMKNEQAKPLLDFLGATQEVTMIVVRWAMVLAPVAVFGLLAQTAMQTGLDALLGMTVYVLTVLGGLLVLLLFYLLIISIILRKPPWWFLTAIREVQLLAFSTSSSAAVMPLSIQVAEDKLGVRPSISQFVIPLGATINMNG
ncbi:MAG: dicarboxylate/amino acid:cation symporter, partial [Firmicutes bacterium]|nr:dicarboxylate/amino acid:cation symporter [Bacillota bacterium]